MSVHLGQDAPGEPGDDGEDTVPLILLVLQVLRLAVSNRCDLVLTQHRVSVGEPEIRLTAVWKSDMLGLDGREIWLKNLIVHSKEPFSKRRKRCYW